MSLTILLLNIKRVSVIIRRVVTVLLMDFASLSRVKTLEFVSAIWNVHYREQRDKAHKKRLHSGRNVLFILVRFFSQWTTGNPRLRLVSRGYFSSNFSPCKSELGNFPTFRSGGKQSRKSVPDNRTQNNNSYPNTPKNAGLDNSLWSTGNGYQNSEVGNARLEKRLAGQRHDFGPLPQNWTRTGYNAHLLTNGISSKFPCCFLSIFPARPTITVKVQIVL